MFQKKLSVLIQLNLFGILSALLCCCAQSTTPYSHLKSNIDAVFVKLDQLDSSTKMASSIPHAEAVFCIEKAAVSARRASSYQVTNNFMLGSAAFFGGAGLALSSAAIGNSDKKPLTISAAVLSILPGAILGAREIFKTYEVVREEKAASSRNVNTAISILRSYALQDDPATALDRFQDCRDGGSSHGWDGGASSQRDTNARLVAEESALQSAELEILNRRRSLFEIKEHLGTLNLEKTAAENEERKAAKALNAATKENRDELTEEHKDSLNILESEQARLDEAQLEAERAQMELDKAIRIGTLQRIVRDKTKEVIDAYAKLRRAILYQSHTEVAVAFDIAEYAKSELESARINLAKEERTPIFLRRHHRKQKESKDPSRVFQVAPLSNPYESHP